MSSYGRSVPAAEGPRERRRPVRPVPNRPARPVPNRPARPVPNRPQDSLETNSFWVGGFATALIAILVATVGIMFARGILGIWILAPERDGTWGGMGTTGYPLASAAIALLATGLMRLLIRITPTPNGFFGCIIGLATVVAVAIPMRLIVALDEQVTLAVINLAIGLCIGIFVSKAASNAVRPSASTQ